MKKVRAKLVMKKDDFINSKKKHHRIMAFIGILYFIIFTGLGLNLNRIGHFIYYYYPPGINVHLTNFIIPLLYLLIMAMILGVCYLINKYIASQLGLICRYCKSNLTNAYSTQIVISTKNCGHCGKQILDDEL